MIGLALIALFALLGPPKFKGEHAHGNGFAIFMPPSIDLIVRDQSPAGVEAQERAEWKLAWICGLIAAVIAALFIHGPYAELFVLMIGALGQTASRLATNSFDYVGHNVEIMVAEREGLEGYRAAEIERMRVADGRMHMSPAQVDAKLRKWEWLARLAVKL